MSQDSKYFVRPKVRFSRSSDVEQEEVISKALAQKKTAAEKSRPKIRNVVSIAKPVKIVRLHEGNKQDVDSYTNDDKKTHSSMSRTVGDNQRALCDTNNDQNKIANVVQPNEDFCDNVPCSPLTCTSINEAAQKDSASETNVNIEAKKDCTKTKVNKGKENQGPGWKKNAPHTDSPKKVETHSQKEIKTQKIVSKVRPIEQSNVTKALRRSTSSNIKNVSSSKKTVCRSSTTTGNKTNLMPCLKFKRTTRSSPVKKTVVRDVLGQKTKVYVGAGVVHRKQDIEIPKQDEAVHIRSNIISGDFAHPQYNSIMCTINKLKEVKKEKVVTDIEHLPTTYKNLVNEKVSTALDFPLEEAVFKNLIDLSIDEKQLPTRLTRSKDPEPRQKDIVPKLSDFFVPETLEEYCVPVCVKPRNPEIVENWNAFRISDKILEWKHSMDYGQH